MSQLNRLLISPTANAINKLPQLSLKLISDSTTADLYRAIRNHLPSLIPGLLPDNISKTTLGLSHSLSRYKLKFSPDKVDTMIVQAIALLDDLDKELNTYAMRVKEWYGWHFPEMGKILNDNLAYSRVILKMGMRTSAAKADLAEILPEEIEAAVKAAAEISMGTEITSEDLENIQALAEQVVHFTDFRASLSSYLSARMSAIAPNLTALVGDLVGARLIAHAGSLMNLAKSPASTIQILGAEKALFRALKTKHDTPKYGLIYHASLIGQATGKNKGKIARMLATKAALGLRVDALADWSAEGEGKGESVTEEEKSALGVENRLKVERRLAGLEGRPLRSKGVAIAPNGIAVAPGKWEVKEARKYNPDADGLAGDEPAAVAPLAKISKKTSMSNPAKINDKVQEGEDLAMEVDSDEVDEEMVDELEASNALAKPGKPLTHKSTTMNGTADHGEKIEMSTVPTDTTDSPPPPTRPGPTILGDTKEAKAARKKERHERKLEDKALKKAKSELRLDWKEKRHKRSEQVDRKDRKDEDPIVKLAEQVGLSVERYKRKLERGEIKFDTDGKPKAISKKDIKRARKEAEKAQRSGKGFNGETSTGKRKRDSEEAGAEVMERSEKKKKRKSKD